MRNGFWWLFALFVVGLIIAWFLQLSTDNLPNLMGAILLNLILAALLGVLLGWLFGRLFGGGGWKNRYTELESRFSSQSSELDGLRSDLNARNSAFADLEGRIAGVQADLDASRQGRQDLRLELDARTNSIAGLQADLNASRQGRDDLRLELDGRTARLAELETQFVSAISERDAEIEGLKVQLKDFDVAKAQIANLEGKISDGAGKDQALADLKAQLQAAEAEKERQLQLRIGEIEGLRSSLVQRDQRISSLEGQVSSGDADRLAELELELGGVRNTVNDRDARILDLEAQLASLRASAGKAGDIEGQLSSLRIELQERNARVLELETDLNASRQGRDDLSGELALRTARIGELESQFANLQNDAGSSADLEQQAINLRYELNDREARVEELETQLASLKVAADAGEVDVSIRSDLETRIAELETDLNASRQGRDDLSGELALRTARIGELETQLSVSPVAPDDDELLRLRAALESRNVQLDKLTKDLSSAQAKSDGVNLQSELFSLRRGLSERDNHIASLESQLSSSFVAPQAAPPPAPAAPAPTPEKRKSRKKKEAIGYRVTQSRVFRADIVPEGYDPVGVIEGIGNSNQQKLWDAGIHSFKDLAETPAVKLKEVIGSNDAFYDEWIVEARRFTRGVYKLTQATTGSRRQADDLTRIEGIGPKMNDALLAAGIPTFEELEAATETQLRSAIEAAGLNFAPSLVTWARQAAYLVRGDEEGFKEYTDYLVAGRDPDAS